jgi:hypothetical protein
MRKFSLVFIGIYFLSNSYSQKVTYSSIKAKYDSIKSSLSYEMKDVADSFEYSCIEQQRVFSLVYDQKLIFDSKKISKQEHDTFKQLEELFFVVNLGDFSKLKLKYPIIGFGVPFGNARQLFRIKNKNYKSYTNIFFKNDTCLANKLLEAPKNDIKVTIDYKNSKFYKQDVEKNKDLRLFEFDFITKPFYYITSSKNYIQLQYMFKGFLVVHKSTFAN